ncbi:flagellar export chaperone FlgN [Lutibacter sp. B2]|nr:flagellar export chaperone FlgN [Lutibacter sp. B2]
MKNNIEPLIDLCCEKENELKKIVKIAFTQQDAIEKEDMEELDKINEQKQSIMDQINKMDINFLTQLEKLKSDLGIASMGDIDVNAFPRIKILKEKISNVMMLLRRIDELDKKNTVEMNKRFDKVKENLRKSKAQNQSKKIAASYTNKYPSIGGVFIDHK